MSNESVVTQWRRGISTGYWHRRIGADNHSAALDVSPDFASGQYHWGVWCAEVGGTAAEGTVPIVGDAKRAATKAGYALLKGLESGQGSMDIEDVTA